MFKLPSTSFQMSSSIHSTCVAKQLSTIKTLACSLFALLKCTMYFIMFLFQCMVSECIVCQSIYWSYRSVLASNGFTTPLNTNNAKKESHISYGCVGHTTRMDDAQIPKGLLFGWQPQNQPAHGTKLCKVRQDLKRIVLARLNGNALKWMERCTLRGLKKLQNTTPSVLYTCDIVHFEEKILSDTDVKQPVHKGRRTNL